MPAPITTPDGSSFAAHRGATGYGWFVIHTTPLPFANTHVIAGPYTGEAAALDRAAELADAHELNLAFDRCPS